MKLPLHRLLGAFNLRLFAAVLLWSIGASLGIAALTLNLVSGTAVLLSKSGSGPLSSTSSNTSIFSPAAYVDYKRFGGEPTVTVDRYPFPGLEHERRGALPQRRNDLLQRRRLHLFAERLRVSALQPVLEIG